MLEFPAMFWAEFMRIMTDGEYAIHFLLNGGACLVIGGPILIYLLYKLIYVLHKEGRETAKEEDEPLQISKTSSNGKVMTLCTSCGLITHTYNDKCTSCGKGKQYHYFFSKPKEEREQILKILNSVKDCD